MNHFKWFDGDHSDNEAYTLGHGESSKVSNFFKFRPDFYVAICWQVENGV
jgi:hypothetical protein